MNKLLLIIIGSLLLISATVTNIVISQPNNPKSIKLLSGYISTNSSDLENALNTYAKIGYVVKSACYNSNGNYLIILEKY